MPSSDAPSCPFSTKTGKLCGRNCMPGRIGCKDHYDNNKNDADSNRLKAAVKWAKASSSSSGATSDSDDDKRKKVSRSSSKPAKSNSSVSVLSFPAEQRAAADFSDIPKLLKQDGWVVNVRASSTADLDHVIEWLCHEIADNAGKAAVKEWKQKTIAAGLQALGARTVDF